MFGRPAVPSVSVADLAPDAYLLDVREDDEWRAGRIDGAVHLPMSQLQARVGEVAADVPVVVVCRVGGRSAQVTAWLVQQGYDAVNLDGGMLAWVAAGRPVVGDAGAGFVL